MGRLERPYEPLTREQAATFAEELRGEASQGHLLHGVEVQFRARRMGYDDFLAYAADLDAPWIGVHLTWTYTRHGKAERPPWPATYLYSSFKDFLAER